MNAHRTLLLALVILFVLGQVLPGTATAVVSTAAPQPLRLAVRSQANASVTGCAALTFRIFLPLIMRGPGAAIAAAATTTAGQPPSDPVAAAPDFASATAFVYTGSNPSQTGMAASVIDPLRAAVLRGQVCDASGQPIAAVQITVLNHSEYGNTSTGAGGIFDMTVNGGGLVTVVYTKTGYLPVQRQVQAPWQDYAWLPDIVMLPLDGQVTAINLSTAGMQVARGSTSSDADGARRATLLVPEGTKAELVLSDGVTQTITNLNVRATEYTVGNAGPLAMPAQLPPSSGYTYALEYTVDEAAGAADVRFSQPLFHYVENFLNFPTGMAVPVGYYDKIKATWIASDNGRVIKIVSKTGVMADVDITGDDIADTGAALATLGITDAERQRLAALYTAGQSLWRVPITHFTPWDCNWPYGPPPGAKPPQPPPPKGDKPKDKNSCQAGSIIECQNQILGEAVDVAGTPFSLHYQSDRTPGRKAAYTLDIALSSTSVPTTLLRIELEVFVAGQRFTQPFSPAPNQHTTFAWDGKDAYGHAVLNEQRITTRIGYVYGAVYQQPAQLAQAFAALSGVPLTNNRARREVTLWQSWQGFVGGWDGRVRGLGGWSLDVLHSYDSTGKVLYLGDGGRRSADVLRVGIINTVAGGGIVPGDGGPATQAQVFHPVGVAIGSDGSYYISQSNFHAIRRVGSNGIITTVAGIGGQVCQTTTAPCGDGGPATQALLNDPEGIAIGPDGSLYVADRSNHRIRRVSPGGIITTVAGTGAYGFSGDGGPATQAQLDSPNGVAVGSDGSLYIADTDNLRIRRVGPDGVITTVAGPGQFPIIGDGGPARQAYLKPYRVAVGVDGSLYIADYGTQRIRRVGTDGIITTVAGTGVYGFSGDGGPATQATLGGPADIAVGPDGSLYIADSGNVRVRWIGPDGIISTIAGNEAYGFSGDGGLATRAKLYSPYGVAMGPDGRLYIADFYNYRVRRVTSALPGSTAGDSLIASEDASEVFVFDGGGRHLRTLDALTGAVRYQFAYDSAGRLASVTDGDGNVTTITRDASGNPTSIVGPYGQATTLTLNADGYLASITNPASEVVQLSYTTDGLLTNLTDARNNTHVFTYDGLGRLSRDTDPAGGFKALTRADADLAYTVTLSTALNRTTTYRIESLPNGVERRVNTLPNGLVDETTRGNDGASTSRDADGTLRALVLGPDPRWGMLAPIDSSATITTPSGLRASFATTRTATLTDTNNPFSLVTLTQIDTINGQPYTSTYTAATRTSIDRSPTGRAVTTTLDALGRVVFEQVAGLSPANYSYDGRGRLVTATLGTGSQARTAGFSYNTNGYLASVTDPLSRTVSFGYDLAGRVISQALPDGRVIGSAYDANGNLSGLTPPGRPAHTFSYTPMDLLSQYMPPDVNPGSDNTQYAYNVDRQLTLSTRPDGQTTSVGYDSAGRLNALTIARGLFGYTYNPTTGKLATINAPGGVNLAYTYDGTLVKNTTWSGPVAGSIGYAYDNDFRVISTTVNSGNAITFQYDSDSLLTQAGTLTLSRSPQNGLLTGSTLGSSTDTRGYNGFAEPTDYSAAYNATPLYNVQYNRDQLGRITVITETTGGVTDVYGYGYDLAGRLTQVNKNSATIASYTYDSNDNRLSFTGPGGTITGTYDIQDRLTQYASATYAYTANGELQSKTVSGQTTSYQYDALGNLMQVTLPAGTQIAYLIDGSDRRIGKRVNGALTLEQGFLYADDLRPIAELDGSNNIISRFVYAGPGNVPDYMIKGGVTYRILADHLGSPRLVVNTASGQVVQRMDYDAFGNIVTDTQPGFQPFGFAGGLYDRDTKLVRFGARDYDAETGRWTAHDPILFNGGQANLYAYVGNDPVNAKDINGNGRGGYKEINIPPQKKRQPNPPKQPEQPKKAQEPSPPPKDPCPQPRPSPDQKPNNFKDPNAKRDFWDVTPNSSAQNVGKGAGQFSGQ